MYYNKVNHLWGYNMLNKMQGKADTEELYSLYRELLFNKEKRSCENRFCLLVIGKGFLNGEEAFSYLEKILGITEGV